MIFSERFIETLIRGKELTINEEKYYISIDKWFFDNVNGTDYYFYKCGLYKKGIKEKGIFRKRTVECYYDVMYCSTYWLDYYNYNGDISKVIDWVVKKYIKNVKERENARIVEQQYVLSYNDEQFKELKAPNE